MTDPAVEAAQRAWASNDDGDWGWASPGERFRMISAAREALKWAADVIAEEIREQWEQGAYGMPGAQIVAQRLRPTSSSMSVVHIAAIGAVEKTRSKSAAKTAMSGPAAIALIRPTDEHGGLACHAQWRPY